MPLSLFPFPDTSTPALVPQERLPAREQSLNILDVHLPESRIAPPTHSLLTSYYSCLRPVYRLTLGNLMPAVQRKTFPLDLLVFPDCGADLSGEIGFMDITFGREKFGRRPQGPQTTPPSFEPPLTILVIGIEPEHQGRGYGKLFLELAEQIARTKQICRILGADVLNDSMRASMLRRGYVPLSHWSPAQLQRCLGMKRPEPFSVPATSGQAASA